MDARSLNPDVQIKQEGSHELFPSHVYDNKAPLWQGIYAVKQEEQTKSSPRTFFKAATMPDSGRAALKKKIADYKTLNDDDRESYLNDRMKPVTCDGSFQPALKGQRGVVAARSLKGWELLGHYAGRAMTDEAYNQGAAATGAALTSVDTYSFALPGRIFLSGLRYGNVTSLINANTSYESNARECSANVQLVRHIDSGRWLILFITCSEIPEGKPLWFDYGKSYWENKNRVIDLTSIEENEGSDDDTTSKDTQLAQAPPLFQRDTATTELRVIAPLLPGTSSACTPQRSGNIANFDLLTEDESGTEPLAELETGSWKQSSPATTESGSSSFDTSSGRSARTIFCQEADCPQSQAKGFRGFAQKGNLDRHMKTQHGAARTIFCQEADCPQSQAKGGRGFVQKGNLDRHMKTRHGAARTIFCQEADCPQSQAKGGRGFVQKGNLDQHMKTRHGAARTIFCQEADCPQSQAKGFRGFAQKGNLDQHMKTRHGAARTIFCQEADCPQSQAKGGRGFAQKGDLDQHMQTRHGAARTIFCQEADCPQSQAKGGRGFAQKGNLDQHMKTQHGAARTIFCQEADCPQSQAKGFRGFAQKGDLDQHMQTRHGAARTIFCQEADCPQSQAKGFRGFVHKGDLNKHMQTQHGAARTIFCQEADCPQSQAKGGRGFVQTGDLNKHMQTQHGAAKPKIKSKMAEKRPSTTRHTAATKKLKAQTSASVSPKEQLRAMQQEAASSSSDD